MPAPGAACRRWKRNSPSSRRNRRLLTRAGARKKTSWPDAQRGAKFQRAGELAYGRIPELEKKLADIEAKENAGEMMEEAVTANHIAQVRSRGTGVAVHTVLE